MAQQQSSPEYLTLPDGTYLSLPANMTPQQEDQLRAELRRRFPQGVSEETAPQTEAPTPQVEQGQPENFGFYRDDGQLRVRARQDEDSQYIPPWLAGAGRVAVGGATALGRGILSTPRALEQLPAQAAYGAQDFIGRQFLGGGPSEDELAQRREAMNRGGIVPTVGELGMAASRNLPVVDPENVAEEVGQAIVQFAGPGGVGYQAGRNLTRAPELLARLGPRARGAVDSLGGRFVGGAVGAGVGDFVASDPAQGNQSLFLGRDEDASVATRKLATGLEGVALAGIGQPVGGAVMGAANWLKNTAGALFRGADARVNIMVNELVERNPEAARAIAAISRQEAEGVNRVLSQTDEGARAAENLTATDFFPRITAPRGSGVTNIENLAQMLPEAEFGDILARREFAAEHFDSIANGLEGLRSLEKMSLAGDFASGTLPRQVETSDRSLQEIAERALRGVDDPVPLTGQTGPEVAERAARQIGEGRAADLTTEAAEALARGQRGIDEALETTASTATATMPRSQGDAADTISRVLTGDMTSPDLLEQGVIGRIRQTQRNLYDNARALASNVQITGAGVSNRIRRAFPTGKNLRPNQTRAADQLRRVDANLLSMIQDIGKRAANGQANWGEIVALRPMIRDASSQLDTGSRAVLSGLYDDLSAMTAGALKDGSPQAARALESALSFTRNEVAPLSRLGTGGSRLLESARNVGDVPLPENLTGMFVNRSGRLDGARLRSMSDIIDTTRRNVGEQEADELRGAFIDVITGNLQDATLRASDTAGQAFNPASIQNFIRQNRPVLQRAGILDEVSQRANQMAEAGQQTRRALEGSRDLDRLSGKLLGEAEQARVGSLSPLVEPTQPILSEGARGGVDRLASVSVDQLRAARNQIGEQGGAAALQSLRRAASESLIDVATKGTTRASEEGARRITGRGLSEIFGDPASGKTRAILDVMFEGDTAMRDNASTVMRVLNRRAERAASNLPSDIKKAAEDGANRALIMLSSVYGIVSGRGIMMMSSGVRDALVFGGIGAKRAVAEAVGEMFSSRENLEMVLQAVRGNKAAQDRLRPIIEQIAKANLSNNVFAALFGGDS